MHPRPFLIIALLLFSELMSFAQAGDVAAPAILADEVWEVEITGSGINVAILSTGIDNEHPGLAGKFVAGYDAVCYMHTDIPRCLLAGNGGRQDDGSFDPDDGNQHGTAIAGMVTSTGLLADGTLTGYRGAAPDAALVDVKIGSDVGAGPFENYLTEQEVYESAMNGLQWVIDHRDDAWPGVDEVNHGIDVMVVPWGITSHEDGGSDGTDMHSRKLDMAVEAGIVVVTAIGNDGPDNDGLSGMAASSLAITVAAIDDQNTIDRSDDTIASYSSRGPRRDNNDGYPYDELKPDVSAPGTNIVQAEGCYTSGGCNNNVPGQDASNNGYSARGSGTGYAAAYVAGVAALVLEANPDLTPAEVKEIIKITADRDDLDWATYPELDPYWNRAYGYGMVNASAAVRFAMALLSSAHINSIFPSPTRTGEEVFFNGSAETAGSENITAYQWSSSLDGELSKETNFSTDNLSAGNHTILFRVQLDGLWWSNWNTSVLSVIINTPPVAIIEVIAPSPVEMGSTVTFSGIGSDSDGSVVAYQWTSSIDGELGLEANFSSSNLSLGAHVITFQVQDNYGLQSNEASALLFVGIGPLANAGDNVSVTPNVLVQFSGAGTDEDGNIVNYEWDFDGDGVYEWSSSENGLTTYIYNNEGTFTAVLRVTDNDGFTSTDSRVITVGDDDEGFLPAPSLAAAVAAVAVIALRRPRKP